MTQPVTGRDLKDWGIPAGRWYKEAMELGTSLRESGHSEEQVQAAAWSLVPERIPMKEAPALYSVTLDTSNELEERNLAGVRASMDEIMRLPTVVAGAVMPDACPSGQGTIPVGGVVATRDAIHPGMHSADICCSVSMVSFPEVDDPRVLLDAIQSVTHFGAGGLKEPPTLPDRFLAQFEDNKFLKGLERFAIQDFGSQGDGNHFAFVGRHSGDGTLRMVTHHGSRGLGNALFKRGMVAAVRNTDRLCPGAPRHNSWIDANSDDGEAYWEALQIVRIWTKMNHQVIQERTAQALSTPTTDFAWNEHNFVFRKDDGLFYHGKGATPSWDGYADDDTGQTLIPLSMGSPILIAEHGDRGNSLGFAPHGAGRNMSRTDHIRMSGGDTARSEGGYLSSRSELPALRDELDALAARGLDIRSFCGIPDLSELPSAYKNADSVRAQIEKYGLARIVHTIEPLGSIMAGDWERNAPWKVERARKLEAKRIAALEAEAVPEKTY